MRGARAEAEGAGETQQRVLEHGEPDPVDHRLSGFLHLHQPRFAQHREMRRHRGLGEIEMLRQFARRHRPVAQELQHAAARRIGKGLEDRVHA